MILRILALLTLLPGSAFATGEVTPSFTLDGQLYADAAGTTALADTGTLTIQILDPGQTCVLYEETQVFDTRASQGQFLASVGAALGAPKRGSLDVNNPMSLVYGNVNATGVPGKLAGGGSCTYVPQAGDARFVRTTVHTDADGLTRALAPDLRLESSPFALNTERAENLQGVTAAGFLKLATPGNPDLTQANLESVFSRYATLQGLLNGTSSAPLVVTPVSTSTSGLSSAVQINPTYNQGSGSAANTDLLINRTETAVGSGAQNFLDLQVAGASKFHVLTTGAVTSGASISAATELNAGNGVYSYRWNGITYSPVGTTSGAPGNDNVLAMNIANVDGEIGFMDFSVGNSANVRQLAFVGAVATAGAASYGPSVVIGASTGPTAYAERVRISPDGSVGIGTSAPQAVLHTYRGVDAIGGKVESAQGVLFDLSSGSGTNGAAVRFNGAALSTAWTVGADPSLPGTPFVFARANNFLSGIATGDKLVTIGSGGNVGIGSTTPTQKLDVAGTINATALTVNGTPVGTSTSSYWNQSGGNLGYTLGSVGIGTNNPIQALDVPNGAVKALGFFGGYLAGGSAASKTGLYGGASSSGVGIDVAGGTASANPGTIVFKTGTASTAPEVARITSAGYVAIGTTVASNALQVNGAVEASGGYSVLYLGKFGGNGYGGIDANTYNANPITFSVQGAEMMRVHGNGSVGIGTANPTTLLQVAGVISPAADNTYALGSAGLRFTNLYAASGVINTSDARLKSHVHPADLGLAFLNRLRPVAYEWTSGADHERHYGLLAQDTEAAIKRETGGTSGIVTHDAATDRYGLRYTELIAPIIKAIQELAVTATGTDDRLRALEARAAAAEAERDAILRRLERLEQRTGGTP